MKTTIRESADSTTEVAADMPTLSPLPPHVVS